MKSEPFTLEQVGEKPMPAADPVDLPSMPPIPGQEMTGFPPSPGAIPAGPTPAPAADKLEAMGRALGRAVLTLVNKFTKSVSDADEKEDFCQAFGTLAQNHPELFRAWVADLIPMLVISSVIGKKVMDRLDQSKKDKAAEQKRKESIGDYTKP